jgi:hypothetical protein
MSIITLKFSALAPSMPTSSNTPSGNAMIGRKGAGTSATILALLPAGPAVPPLPMSGRSLKTPNGDVGSCRFSSTAAHGHATPSPTSAASTVANDLNIPHSLARCAAGTETHRAKVAPASTTLTHP